MRKRLKSISPVKAGLVLGVLYGVLSLIAVPFLMLAGAMASSVAQPSGTPIPFSFLFGIGALFLPILYGVMGFLAGLICALIYNLIAKFTGGFEITLEDVA